ncbi:MAG TPA: DUF1549 domain-containing protein [Gemmata sp.]|nr:DUF1549 domain-containing protein [Gemmata sp.]
MTRVIVAAALATGLLCGSAAFGQEGVSPQTQKINELIAKGWEAGGVATPAKRAGDEEFHRRVFIDLIGRIPTPEEVQDFMRDKNRAKLVNRLLNSQFYQIQKSGRPVTAIPGLKLTTRENPKTKKTEVGIDYANAYAENFAELWTTWMLTRSNTHEQYRTQFRTYLADRFYKDTPWDKVVQEVISATGRTGDNNAVVFVLRHLGDPIVDADARRQGVKEDFAKDGKYDAVPITSRVTRLFLGVKTQCVQCHDHPFHQEYVQADFWGVNAFFRQTDRSGSTNPPRNMPANVAQPQLTLSDVPAWNGGGLVLYERRDGQRKASYPAMLKDLAQAEAGEMSDKKLVSGNVPEKFQGMTRRQVLAQWVTEHDNFSRAFVNRMWGHLFGRGLNAEPSVDDFSLDNKVVHPELLDYLAAEFKKYGYDPKKLLEWICTSDVYQLSHVANKAYADPKFDPYFARMPLKAMSPEVLFESLAVATRAETRKDKAAFDRLKSEWTQRLTQNFGDDEGNEVSFNGTVVQALLMMNGRDLNGEIGTGKGNSTLIPDVIKKVGNNPRAVYTELFLMTVGRPPTNQEIARLDQVRKGVTVEVGAPAAPKATGSAGTRPPATAKPATVYVPPATDEIAFYQDVFWALLNSSEFMLNH